MVAANVFLRSTALSSTWTPLSPTPVVVDVTLLMRVTGGLGDAGATFELRNGDQTVAWPLNQTLRLAGVNLAEIEVRSTYTNMQLCIAGNTR